MRVRSAKYRPSIAKLHAEVVRILGIFHAQQAANSNLGECVTFTDHLADHDFKLHLNGELLDGGARAAIGSGNPNHDKDANADADAVEVLKTKKQK